MFRENKVISPSEEKNNPVILYTCIYEVAQNAKRDPSIVKFLKLGNFDLDVQVNGSRPITRLATESNHQAVEFLIRIGSNPQYAVETYAICGHFLTKQNAKFLLSRFSDPDIRKRIADRAKNIPGIDIDFDTILEKLDLDINKIVEVDNRIKF
jgi:hypothetical protein